MPYPHLTTCLCRDGDDPTPRYCVDDLFCPQCGKSVAWIDSDHLLPVPDQAGGGSGRPALWVYRREEADGRFVYELDLVFFEIDPLGGRRPRALELSRAGCSFRALGFDTKVGVEPGGGSRAVLRLTPLAPDDLLPAGGVRGRLTLAGNCGVVGKILAGRPGDYDGLDVLVFNEPDFSTIVLGKDVQKESDSRDTWQLWRDGPQELTIEVEPTGAQVYLLDIGPKPSWPIEEDPDLRLGGVKKRPDPNAIYGPGRAATIVFELNPDTWPTKDSQILRLRMDFALGQSLIRDLALKRQAEGMLRWAIGEELIVERMFYGEKATTPPESSLLPEIAVSNESTTPLPAQVPRIEEESFFRNFRWIEAGWADGSETFKILEKDQKGLISLGIDLTNVNPVNHPPGRPLKAKVVIQHLNFGKDWELGVNIKSVGHWPSLGGTSLGVPLALDFGNTNSYGSAELQGPGQNDPIAVRSILGRSKDPETFASALAFRDFDVEEHPAYEIGGEALDLGRKNPLRLEQGLKRALSALRPVVDDEGDVLPVDHDDHEFNNKRYSYKLNGGGEARYSLRDLVGFFLLAAIDRCETGERGIVTELGLSYPANLGPEPRRALNLAIEDVEAACKKRCAARNPKLVSRIKFSRLGPDEASAVALGFVLDDKTLNDKIKPLFRDGTATFTLASFDFGGGSIDIALIRFDLDGLPPLTKFASSLLGLGGDEHFGGDNVTVATYEILASKLAKALGPRKELPLAPLNVHRNRAEPRGWANRQALWVAAEAAKRAACRGEPASAREEIASALAGLHAEDRAVLSDLATELAAGGLDVPLVEIYDHPIRCDLSGIGGYRVRDRLGGCVRMLGDYVKRARVDVSTPTTVPPDAPSVPSHPQETPVAASPRFIVLAGAGCRVPLARELLRKAFPDAEIVPEEEVIPASYRPKSKVADGLARFLTASRGGLAGPKTRGLKPAHLFTHADLLWINPFHPTYPVVWVPSCVELAEGAWHPLMLDDGTGRVVPLESAWSRHDWREIDVHRRAQPEPELVGTARLDRKADLIEPNVTPVLPEPSAELDQAEVLLRIDGEEDHLRLRIRMQGQEFGDWKVRPVAHH